MISDETVKEGLLGQGSSCVSANLYDEIVNGLAPFLLSSIIAKSEKARDDLVLKVLKERFEVRTSERLTVSFSLMGSGASIERTRDFPKFYLQRRVIQSGIIKEAHYTLHVAGNETTCFTGIDADALGEAIGPVFADGAGSEVISLFPRIASRYQQLVREKGRTHAAEAMADFMYNQLHISREAQEDAFSMTAGETSESDIARIPVPPAAKLVLQNREVFGEQYQTNLKNTLSPHEERLIEKAKDFVRKLESGARDPKRTEGDPGRSSSPEPTPAKHDLVTAEQAERGRIGEEEIKRRLLFPGGYMGFTFVADTRNDGCGYDFLGTLGDQEVKLEVKAFTIDGRVVVTTTELQEAAASGDSYWLVGILDNKDSPHQWPVSFVQDPIHALLRNGELDVIAKLQAAAVDIFPIENSQCP